MMFRALALVVGIGACGGAQSTGTPPPAPSTSVAAPSGPRASDVHLVRSKRAREGVPTSGVHVAILPNALFLEDAMIATLPFTHADAGELVIAPLATALASVTAKEAILAVDARVTYRTLIEVLYTLGRHEIGQYHFVVRYADRPQSIDVTAPKAQTRDGSPTVVKSELTVIITDDGFSLKARGGNIKTGCTDVGPGLAIVNGPSGYDLAELDRCRGILAGTGVMSDMMVLVANPSINFETVVGAIDALAETFPHVSFGVSK